MQMALSVLRLSDPLYKAWLLLRPPLLSPLSSFAALAFEFHTTISVQSHTPLYKRVFFKRPILPPVVPAEGKNYYLVCLVSLCY